MRTKRKQVETCSKKNSIKDSTTETHSRSANNNPRKDREELFGKNCQRSNGTVHRSLNFLTTTFTQSDK
jgi:hypothetical protein